MLNNVISKKIVIVLDNIIENGPKWKIGKAAQHYKKRAYHGHIPSDWSLESYNQLIIRIANKLNNETYLYYKDTFKKRYFVIVMKIGLLWLETMESWRLLFRLMIIKTTYRQKMAINL